MVFIGRLNSDGTLDRSFKPAVANDGCIVAVQADGKIVMGGQFGILDGQPRLYTGRLNADGSLDLSFNPGYFAMGAVPLYHRNDAYEPYVSSLAVQADGKILVAGMFAQLAGQSHWNIGRLNADGTLDTTFDPGINETYPTVSSLVVQADGKILVAGQFKKLGGQSRTNIGRIYNTGAATESLVFHGTTVTWMRGGTGPEVWRTTFEYSFNGSSWTNLGAGTRIPGGWQLSRLALPTNSTLRARGYTPAGFLETILRPALAISDMREFVDGQVGFNVSGPFGQAVVIEGSPDLQAWTPLRTNNMAAEPILFSDSQATVFATRFYRLRAKPWLDTAQAPPDSVAEGSVGRPLYFGR